MHMLYQLVMTPDHKYLHRMAVALTCSNVISQSLHSVIGLIHCEDCWYGACCCIHKLFTHFVYATTKHFCSETIHVYNYNKKSKIIYKAGSPRNLRGTISIRFDEHVKI